MDKVAGGRLESEMLQVSRQAGEHVQQETSVGIVNLDPLIGSLEEAFSICLQRGRARAAPRRLEQDDYRPLRGWHQLACNDFHLPSLRAASWMRDTHHNMSLAPSLSCACSAQQPQGRMNFHYCFQVVLVVIAYRYISHQSSHENSE